MADFTPTEKISKKPGVKKKNIRMDMTPMVDLGFLLITFFMFAASFSKPSVMDLGLPAKSTLPGPANTIGTDNQVTFILGKDHRIFYYQQEIDQLSAKDLSETSYSGLAVAKTIQKLKKAASKPDIFTVIIKPSDDSTYKDFVDVMDEMALSKHEIYGVTDLKEKEKAVYGEVTLK